MPLTARCSPGASPPGSKGYMSRLQPRPPPNSSPSTARPPGGPTTATTTVGRCTGCRPAGVGGRVQRDHRHPTPARTPRPTGALVTIDAMRTQARIAQAILDRGATAYSRSRTTSPACATRSGATSTRTYTAQKHRQGHDAPPEPEEQALFRTGSRALWWLADLRRPRASPLRPGS